MSEANILYQVSHSKQEINPKSQIPNFKHKTRIKFQYPISNFNRKKFQIPNLKIPNESQRKKINN